MNRSPFDTYLTSLRPHGLEKKALWPLLAGLGLGAATLWGGAKGFGMLGDTSKWLTEMATKLLGGLQGSLAPNKLEEFKGMFTPAAKAEVKAATTPAAPTTTTTTQ